LWCAQEELNARRNGKTPGVQPWNAELVRALDLELRVSSTRHEWDCTASESDHDDWIGTAEAARILQWNVRRIQRRADDLDGRKIGRQLMFRESAVREYAEGLTG
jgi:hypothetical protein